MWTRGAVETFATLAENSNTMRVLGAGQVGFDLWLALRQYRDRD